MPIYKEVNLLQLFCDSDTSESIKTQDTDYEMIHNHDGYGFQLTKTSEPGKGKTVKIHLGLTCDSAKKILHQLAEGSVEPAGLADTLYEIFYNKIYGDSLLSLS